MVAGMAVQPHDIYLCVYGKRILFFRVLFIICHAGASYMAESEYTFFFSMLSIEPDVKHVFVLYRKRIILEPYICSIYIYLHEIFLLFHTLRISFY